MALQMSRAEVMRLAKKAESLQNRVKRATEKADLVIEKVVRTAEVGSSAFGFGLIQGRYGLIEIAGVPIDLAAGIGGHLLGFMGVGGQMNSHLHSLADGALAAYAVTMGRGAGEKWRVNALSGGDSAKISAKTSGAGLSDSEMASLSGV